MKYGRALAKKVVKRKERLAFGLVEREEKKLGIRKRGLEAD